MNSLDMRDWMETMNEILHPSVLYLHSEGGNPLPSHSLYISPEIIDKVFKELTGNDRDNTICRIYFNDLTEEYQTLLKIYENNYIGLLPLVSKNIGEEL